MNQPANPSSPSPPWLLIIGLLAGGGLLVFMAWDSIFATVKKDTQRGSVNLVHLTNANWQKEVIESDIPVLVDFSAEWCGPCHQLAPTINTLADRYKGKVKVAKFDVGDQSFNKGTKLRQQYHIDGIPCVIVFKGGEARFQSKGGTNESELVSVIERILQ